MRPFKSIPGPGISGVPLPGIELKRLFCCPCDNRTPGVLSAPICGSEGEKRISLTQGERLREGSAPSDKQGLGLISKSQEMLRHCTGQIPALINKAAEHNKGRTPLWITCGLELDHRYRPMSIIIV